MNREEMRDMNWVRAPMTDNVATLHAVKPVIFRVSVCLFLIVTYLPVFSLYARQHWRDLNLQGAYAHAPLAIIIIGFLVWSRRYKLSKPALNSKSIKGFLLLTLGVTLEIYGEFQGYVVLQGMSLIPVLLGLLHSYYGADTIRALRFPLLLLFFVVPLPGAAIDALTQPLLNVAADMVATVLPVFNINVVKTGHALTVNAVGSADYHQVIMAPECSGIRSFVSLLALSSVFAHMQGRRAGHSALLMLLTIPLVILGNCIRVMLTILMIVYVSPDTAQNYFHWSSGLLLFAVTLIGLFLVDGLLTRVKFVVGSSRG